MDSEFLPYAVFFLGLVAAALFVLYIMERERRKPLTKQPGEYSGTLTWGKRSSSTRRSVAPDVFEEAREKLRILDVEQEILSYAVRRLYEAGAEGKITAQERDSLALKYKMDLTRIKEEIARGESIVALNELERMQEDFVKLFSERFEELNKRIDKLRQISGFPAQEPEKLEEKEEGEVPGEEILKEEIKDEEQVEAEEPSAKPLEEPPRSKKRTVSPKPPQEPEKSEAEKKVEQIVAEVEKVLQKLGQMEVED